MARRTVFVLGIIISLVIVSVSFAQGSATPDAGQVAAPVEVAATATPAVSGLESEMQWLWGKAVTVDIEKNEIMVRYQDYDTDEEKEMFITVDDKTGFENVRSLAQVQPQDTLSIDYKVTTDGKNTAKNISVEKAQDAGIEGAVQAAPAAVAAATDAASPQAVDTTAAPVSQQ